MRFLKALLIVLFVFCALVFFHQNGDALNTPLELHLDTKLGYEWSSTAVPFYLVVLLAFLAGCLLTFLLLLMERIRICSKLRKAKREIAQLKSEVSKLREIPLPTGLEVSSADKPDGVV